MTQTLRIPHSIRRTEANAMVELALILPVLILLLLATLDIGEVLVASMIVTQSARTAAIASTQYYMAADTSDVVNIAYVASGTYGGFPPHFLATAQVSCTCGVRGTGVSCAGSCAGNTMPAQYMTVTTTANIPLFFGVTGLPASIPVKSVASYRTAWTGGL